MNTYTKTHSNLLTHTHMRNENHSISERSARTLCVYASHNICLLLAVLSNGFAFVFTLYIYIREIFDQNGFFVKWTKRYRQLLLAKLNNYAIRGDFFFLSFSFDCRWKFFVFHSWLVFFLFCFVLCCFSLSKCFRE